VTKDDSGDSDGDSSSSGSSGEDEQEVQIKFPRDDAQALHQFISRDITNMQNRDEP
jgi:hypothetical protein